MKSISDKLKGKTISHVFTTKLDTSYGGAGSIVIDFTDGTSVKLEAYDEFNAYCCYVTVEENNNE